MINFKDKLEPKRVTGFIDGEGYFSIYLGKCKNRKSG